jgi:hypothetical protein
MLTSAVCGLARPDSCLTLLCGNSLVLTGHSQGVRVSEQRARGERVGCAGQGRCQALRGLPRVARDELSLALAVGDVAQGGGVRPATSRLLTELPLLEPAEAVSLSLRRLPLSGLLALIGPPFAPIRGVFAVVGGRLSLIRDPVALIRDPVALIRGHLALIRYPLTLVGHSLIRRRLSALTTPMTLATQPGTLALQGRIVGRELRRPALNLRAEALDLGPGYLITRLERAGVQLPQIRPVCFERRRFTL